ncbi:hypothetical protein Halha_1460 [Halobacteroides halobius DSM 5150]|uniref:Uncharacterized protein n=1 Tax=Halobacteroides halobius (strain ATCC 35273 / DSM 5150 / MD-1) TaxID=748449 RepID=L0KA51_HALHC|nr:hypothetical protein [Halobacteroides halobius]AGB41405.1 hypothetical protein Halha_1460 [Halobacteroides halobius DSM 5150]
MSCHTKNDNSIKQFVNQEISIQEYIQSLFSLARERDDYYQ